MYLTQSQADIWSAVRDAFQPAPPERLGVAVSGGGDSVALLHILTRCFEGTKVELHAATVDHGLRPESRREAEWVADLCEALGVTHSTLRWRGWDGLGIKNSIGRLRLPAPSALSTGAGLALGASPKRASSPLPKPLI